MSICSGSLKKHFLLTPSLFCYYLKTFKGPDDTPFAGGTYEVDIVIPTDYPFSPPKMKFITKSMWNKYIQIILLILKTDIFLPLFI